MAHEVTDIALNNGVEMPSIGLGVFQTPPDETRSAVAAALDTGYRHIDTAAAYGNEREVGEAVQDRKSTRLNSSHMSISYAVFCLKKKKKKYNKKLQKKKKKKKKKQKKKKRKK